VSFTFRPAKRENVPLLIGLAGGTGIRQDDERAAARARHR
jgi:hypothetical protein